jgi:ATP-dependent DNA ligase
MIGRSALRSWSGREPPQELDGEVVCCDCGCLPCAPQTTGRAPGIPLLRRLTSALPDAFDLLELDGTDLRPEPIEVRKATLASILRKSRHAVRLNEHLSTTAR